MHLNDILQQCSVLPNVSLTRAKESATLRLHTDDGQGAMTFFDLWPGFTLAFIHISAPRWPAPTLPSSTENGAELLLVNLCLNGRCELVLDDNRFVYVADGDVAYSTRHATGDYVYPRHHYEGIEFFIEVDQLTRERPWLRDEFGLDLPALIATTNAAARTYVSSMNEKTAHCLRNLWPISNAPDLPALRRESLSLFAALVQSPKANTTPRPYFTASQVAIAKETEVIVTADLRISHPARALAAHFGVSETSLKNYFRGVYGQSLADYVRERRMAQAATLLAKTAHSVAHIAETVGYLNQSKFAAVFKRHYGITPLEYRRRAHLHTP